MLSTMSQFSAPNKPCPESFAAVLTATSIQSWNLLHSVHLESELKGAEAGLDLGHRGNHLD